MLDAKIRELNCEVGPRELEIEALRGQIAAVDRELLAYHAANRAADARIGGLRAELAAAQAGAGGSSAAHKAKRAALAAFERDLYVAVRGMGSRAGDAVAAAGALQRAHAPPAGGGVQSALDLDVIAESVRQQQHLAALNASLRAAASSSSSAARSSGGGGGGGGGGDAAALVGENATLLAQIGSLKALTRRIRADAAALQYKAKLEGTARAGASGAGARAAASIIGSAGATGGE